ncbi:hypothetical protein GCM10007916_22010 [Psychromonas marina]|uniref:TIGR04219 family outer membrane beta-barrel protein n=1 Tax=Psychromonas marina TaxID=88364 RepID=A0ABQ6E117_9GAMM|nr:hypothetical protein [Psychromonas marina]GLS91132.1 hypothetical protein GCM10007916_22010 [Psychromonas marina]
MTIKKIAITALSLCSAPLLANVQQSTEDWPDLSDPRAVYSSVSIAAGNDGVNLSATYGGYLNGLYKHKFTVEAMNDLEYYNVDYMVINANTETGFALESTWSRDNWKIDDHNDTSVGIFTKIPLMGNQLNVYPKLDVGMIWGEDIKTTTYVKLDATTRYSIDHMFWVGVTPTYTYAMQGYELNEWEVTFDAGVQLSEAFSFVAHIDDDLDFSFDVVFTF